MLSKKGKMTTDMIGKGMLGAIALIVLTGSVYTVFSSGEDTFFDRLNAFVNELGNTGCSKDFSDAKSIGLIEMDETEEFKSCNFKEFSITDYLSFVASADGIMNVYMKVSGELDPTNELYYGDSLILTEIYIGTK